MMYALLFGVELLFGVIVGFFLSDSKKGLSTDELKFSSVLFILANAFVFWKNPNVPAIIFAHMAISWFVLIIGVLGGEVVKLRLIRKILRTIQKKDIELAVNNLVNVAATIAMRRRRDDMNNLENKLAEVHKLLYRLEHKDCYDQNETFKSNLRYLHELCDSYVELSMSIWHDYVKGQINPDRVDLWTNIGEQLKSISWDTLNHAESHMVEHLSRVFPLNLVRQAMHK